MTTKGTMSTVTLVSDRKLALVIMHYCDEEKKPFHDFVCQSALCTKLTYFGFHVKRNDRKTNENYVPRSSFLLLFRKKRDYLRLGETDVLQLQSHHRGANQQSITLIKHWSVNCSALYFSLPPLGFFIELLYKGKCLGVDVKAFLF